MRPSLLLLLFLMLSSLFHGQFQSGDRIELTEPSPDDIYIAGGEVKINAPVYGDCIAAGGNIAVNDSITGDLIIGGGEVDINGDIGDDIRVAGGSITINSEVMDDLIVFGGDIHVTSNSVIYGNVVSYGGELSMDGTVLGAMKASGGDITISGDIHGPTSVSAGSLTITEGAKFFSEVSYWTENGEVDFGTSLQDGEARFDDSLAWKANDNSKEDSWFGFSIFFLVMFLLGGLLILLLMEWAFGKWFTHVAGEVKAGWPRSLGIGVLYIIGVPVLVILSFVIIVGIPVGVLALVIYLFSLLFGKFVAALVITHFWKADKGQEWGVVKVSLIALIVALGLQILTSVPILGALISFIVLCVTYGAILLTIHTRNSSSSMTDLSSTVSDLG